MGVCLEGHVMVPNLGYKKDTFLELSLVSNFLSDIPYLPNIHNRNMSSTCCITDLSHKKGSPPYSSTSSPTSSNGWLPGSIVLLRVGW